MDDSERTFAVRLGPVDVDLPKSMGYFGGVGIAAWAGLIDPPLALFIAAVPLVKLLRLSRLPPPVNILGEVIEGMAKPVGGDDEAVIRPGDEVDQEQTKQKAPAKRTRTARPSAA
jgi:hypothetical protein